MVVVGGLLVSVTVPSIGAADSRAREMKNGTQLRGLHQSNIIYAEFNRDRFPGINGGADAGAGRYQQLGEDEDGIDVVPYDADAVDSGRRFAILLYLDIISSDLLLNPGDVEKTAWEWTGTHPAPLPDVFTTQHYSYATQVIDGLKSGSEQHLGRIAEWHGSINAQACPMSDRVLPLDGASDENVHSLWNEDRWEGNLVWNDNHVTYESDHNTETSFDGRFAPEDNIFAEAPEGAEDTAGLPGSNSLLAYEGTAATVNWETDQ